MGKTICLDFDGVLASYDGWKGPKHFGVPMPGARKFVETLLASGYDVVVCSTREAEDVAEWLVANGFPWTKIQVTNRKPPAFAYVDDRGLKFNGSFNDVLDDLRDFRAWWEE